MKLSTILLSLAILFPIAASSQDSISKEDYDRAVSYMWKNVNNKKAFNLYIQPHWFSDSSGLWYEDHASDGKKYRKIALPDFDKSDLFDHKKLATILRDSLGEEIKSNDLPIDQLEYQSARELLVTVKGKQYVFDTHDNTLSIPETRDEANENEKVSPDKKWVAYSKDYNLYIKSTETDEIRKLSTSGKKGYEYATWFGWGDLIEGEGGERPDHFSVEWSEDSKWIYTNVCDLRTAQKMYLLDWSQDTLYRPNLLSYYRGSPGDTTMIYEEPVFFNVETGEEIKPDLPRSTHINAVSMRWSATSGKVFLQRSSRGFQHIYLYSFDLKTDNLQTIYEETSDTNIDNFSYRLSEDDGKIFFLSEKSGWRQLYALDIETQKVNMITGDGYYINRIDRIDGDNKRIFFRASGKEDKRNPYHHHLYSISFEGEDLQLLTKEDRHHQVSFSPNGKYFVDNYSTVDIETITVLRSANNGTILQELGKADVTELVDWNPPQVFTAMAHDGKTSIYGALWKPSNFDPAKKYAIIDHSYTGPHTQRFPKDFRRGISIGNQSFAELGFVVIVLDGFGSSGRSKEFHNYSYKNLGGNLADHVGAIRQLGTKYSWIDTTRVGIFGHSAGGYDAGHAVLAYPDFYKVAVASSADHDHRMEKAWWPEMYMGWPVDSAYHLQSNITMAGNLQGKLLITHGGIDENVNPSATFKLAEALIKADKQFDMLILPSQHHGYRGQHLKYFTKKRWNYFVEHLRGVQPIWDIDLD